MKRLAAWIAGLALLAVVALGIAFYTPDTDPAAMRAKYGGPPSRFVDLGEGLTVHLRDEGPRDAPVIMLLHGSNVDLHTWDAWAARLSTRYRIIRYDQIGHGLTGPSPARDYSMAAFVRSVDRLTTKLGIARFALAGNSMGGGVAWNYALAHPERLTALILVNASGAPEPAEAPPPFAFRVAQSAIFTPVLLHVTPRSLIASGVRSAVADPARVSETTIDRYWELLRYPGNRQATIDRQSVPRIKATAARLATIRTPTLVIWGDKDALLPVAGGHWFAGAIPRASKVVYRDIGHVPMEEIPARSAADLARWLTALPHSGALDARALRPSGALG